jgi:fructoselysine-6-P-deglycase FrlB-like protein
MTSDAFELLSRRIEAVPDELERTLAASPGAAAAAAAWVTTGAGGSEGPARALALALEARGQRARFVPLSCFAHPTDLEALAGSTT